MANPVRGEVTLTLGGQTFTLKIGTNALIEFQELFSTDRTHSLAELMGFVHQSRVKYVRGFLWAALRKYHADLSLEDVSDLLDGADPGEIHKILVGLGASTSPDPVDVAELGLENSNGRPPKAQAASKKTGTGARSSSTRDASA